MYFILAILPIVTIVQGLVPYAGTTAELTKLSNYGPRYDSHLLRSVVPPFSSFPISCQVEHSNGKGYSIFVIDQPSKFENYVNRKELTREHCTPNGLHQDDCFVRWWPNIYLKWVQINYSRDYRKTGKVQDAWLTAKSVSTWRPEPEHGYKENFDNCWDANHPSHAGLST